MSHFTITVASKTRRFTKASTHAWHWERQRRRCCCCSLDYTHRTPSPYLHEERSSLTTYATMQPIIHVRNGGRQARGFFRPRDVS